MVGLAGAGLSVAGNVVAPMRIWQEEAGLLAGGLRKKMRDGERGGSFFLGFIFWWLVCREVAEERVLGFFFSFEKEGDWKLLVATSLLVA